MYETALKYEFKATMNSLTFRMILECNLNKIQELLLSLNFALKHYIIEVQSYLQKIFERNADIILDSVSLLGAHPRVLNWIYSLNDLNIDEWDLIAIAEKYKKFHMEAGRHSISSQIQPAIHNIRFLSMTVPQVTNTTFLSDEEKDCFVQVMQQEASDKCIPMYFSRRRIGRCNKTIQILCHDDRLKKLFDENKVKLCTFKEKKYFVKEDGKIVACVENSGIVVPCEFQELTPVKDREPKKVFTGIQQSVLYYKENKKIWIDKNREPTSKVQKERINDAEAATVTFGKMSLWKH